jgi:protocatechuate 3,4-dioxygenase beta subunit
MTTRHTGPRAGRFSPLILLLLLAPLLAQAGSPLRAFAAPAAATCSGTATPALTEGPYYKAGSPERTSLLTPGMAGTKLTITGVVYDRNCNPVAHAWLDFWQANAAGAYDNAGYTLRGYQYTDAAGRYTLETVVPGEYPGRTVHIHVKVRAGSGSILTTQLFMPGVARNGSDGIFNQALLMRVQDTAAGKNATFDFVLNTVVAASTPAAQPTAAPTAVAAGHTFTETGFTVSGEFWTAWQGGRAYADSLYINGLPISAARNEVSPTDGKTYLTQWFERARFELHPENAAPYRVLLGLLGAAAAQGRQTQAAFRAVANPGGAMRWFPETGHTLGDASAGGRAIAAAWARMGGLAQFGFPLSQPVTEVSKDDGKPYLVQYFERQRLEYHPENAGGPFEILLGRLGAEQMK